MEETEVQELKSKIELFKRSLEEKLKLEYEEKFANNEQENIVLSEIIEIKYYDLFEFKTKTNLEFSQKDVYIVELKNGEFTTYEIYFKGPEHKMAEINFEGQIEYNSDMLDSTVTLDELEEKNIDNLSDEYRKRSIIQTKNEKEADFFEDENEENIEEIEEEKEEELIENPEEQKEQLEKDLNLVEGDIRFCTEIKLTGKDNLFRNKVKESREYDKVQLVYISSEDCYRFVGLKKGQPPKFFETIGPSQGTMRTSSNMDTRNEQVEQKNLNRLMKFTDSKDYDFAVRVVQYGNIELDMLRRDEVTGKYMSTPVETKPNIPNVSDKSQEKVNKIMDKNKNTRINEELDEIEEEKQEQGPNSDVKIDDISDKGREEKEQDRTLDENIKKYYY